MRDCFYEYHRLGIDVLYEDIALGRKNIYKALSKLNRIVATNPNSVNMANFTRSKQQEIINLFDEAEAKEQTDLINLMQRLDPANVEKYEEIRK